MCAICAMLTPSCVTGDFQSGLLQPENSHRAAARPQSIAIADGFIFRVTSRRELLAAGVAALFLRFAVFRSGSVIEKIPIVTIVPYGYNEHTRSLSHRQL